MSKLDNLGNVLIRSDLNVPIKNGEITDNFRILKSIEILESIGVLIQDLEREASPISDGNRIAFCTSIENEFGEIDLDKDIDDPDKYEKHVKNTRPYLNISQTEIERVLRKTIKENPYIDLLSGHTWKSVEDMDETVLAEVEDVNNAQDIKIAAK